MKQLLSFVLAVCLVAAAAQTLSAQVRFGVKAGLNLANMSIDPDDGVDTKMIPTFLIGGQAEFGLTDNVGLGVGLQVSGKGFKVEEETELGDISARTNPIYLQVPVSVFYQSNGFYIGAGPYIGFGIAGKAKSEFLGESDTESIEFGNTEDDDFNPLDFGIGAEIGYNINNFRITASYNLGLSNAVPKDVADTDDITAKHGVIGIGVAYMFGSNE